MFGFVARARDADNAFGLKIVTMTSYLVPFRRPHCSIRIFPEFSSLGDRYSKKTSCGHGGRWRNRGRKAGEMGYSALCRHGSFRFSADNTCHVVFACFVQRSKIHICPVTRAVPSLTSKPLLIMSFILQKHTRERPAIQLVNYYRRSVECTDIPYIAK